MNIWKDIDPSRITKDEFIACIEISKGSKMKYELDKQTGRLILDRVLYTSTHYPHNYGFIPKTLADDGDALDVLVISSEPIVPLALVECRPIGMLEMLDGGQRDAKILAVAVNDPTYQNIQDVGEIPDHSLREIKHFFTVYKQLEGKNTIVDNVRSPEKAKKVIQSCIDAYYEKFGEDPVLEYRKAE